MVDLNNRTFFITGASRGIGRAIALMAAKHGANIVIAAKTDTPHEKLSGTIHTVADEVQELGGKALPLVVDVRNDEAINEAVEKAAAEFGGIDILINNASAIMLQDTEALQMKHFDLMMDVNARGAYSCIRACLPWLKKSDCAHVITMSPPVNMNPQWLGVSPAYAMSKYGMTIATLGAAAGLATDGIRANTLWPQTLIGTAAIKYNFPERYLYTRKPEIVSDAVEALLTKMSPEISGQSLIDELILKECGTIDFEQYRMSEDHEPALDLFLDK